MSIYSAFTCQGNDMGWDLTVGIKVCAITRLADRIRGTYLRPILEVQNHSSDSSRLVPAGKSRPYC
jgi:hypothetical protein